MPNDHLLPDELAMRERCERATAGPCEVHADFNIRAPDPRPGRYSGKPTTQCPLTNSALSFEQRKANITLCAHARADIPELLTRLAAERAEVERLRGPQTLSIADDAPISGYAEYECFPGKLIACTGSVEIEIEETGHGGFGGCKHTIDFPGVKTVRQLRMLLEMLGTPTPAE